MPEPGVSDRNFDRPTADRNPGTDRMRGDARSKDLTDRNSPRRRSRGPMRLLSEYADFKLADGRSLREVMGDRFFGSAAAGGDGGDGKFMSKGVREKLRKDGSPVPARLSRQRVRAEEQRARAEEQRARDEEQRARDEARKAERRARMEARRVAHPGGNFNPGGEL